MIRTGDQYLESLRDGRRVYTGGELIRDVTTHPKTRDYAHAIAEYYDLHHKPELQDQLTFVDEDGERRAMHWFLPRSKEDVVRRRKYHEFWWRHFKGANYTRPPASMLPVMYTQVDDPEPWEENSTMHDGRPLAKYIRQQWIRLKSEDLSFSPMFLDVQYDRSRDEAPAETPMLSIVDKNDDGIIIRGWKAIGTSIPFANEILIGILWRPGNTPEQTVYALCPINAPGVSIFCRPSRVQPDADPYDHPLATLGDELDGMAYFEDVFIPWEQVQHVGNPDHAKWYPQRQFDWIHTETQIRHVTNAELIAGLGLLVTYALGTNGSPIVQSQLADLVRFRETCRAFMIAAEETGFYTPGGLYKPNNIFVDFGRAYYLENVHDMINTLIDFCGRGVVVTPTKADFDDPYIGPKLEEALRGTHISARDRTKIFRVIQDRFLSEYGARQEMFEKFNGTPLYLIRLLTMQRTEYQVDGPLTELAREVVGLGDTEELAKRAEEAERRSHYASARYQPEYARAQDIREGEENS
jgi:aromatic ring hydroxylase